MDNALNVLHSIQKNLKAPKNQWNAFGNYNYRNAEDILEAVKSILPDNCFVILSDDIIQLGDRYYVKATAELHTPDFTIHASGVAREALSKKGMDEAQISGAASSYARKYALNGLFAIDDGKDSDSQDNRSNDKPKSKPQSSNKEKEDPVSDEDKWAKGFAIWKSKIKKAENLQALLDLHTDMQAESEKYKWPAFHKGRVKGEFTAKREKEGWQ